MSKFGKYTCLKIYVQDKKTCVIFKVQCIDSNVNITTDPERHTNKSKLIDLVMRIELTREFLSSRLSDFQRNSIIHFRMFLSLVTCFLSVAVSLLCRSQARIITSPFTNQIDKFEHVSLIQLGPAQQRNRDSQEICYQIYKRAKMGGRISQIIFDPWR